jgi:hypothetical protein
MSLIADKALFDTLGCPLITIALELVQKEGDFSVGQSVEFQTDAGWKSGTVFAIGAKAHYWDGTPVTAFAIKRRGACHLTLREGLRLVAAL